MSRVLILSLIFAFCVSHDARATSYAQPERQEIYSSNREFILVVDPHTRTHKISRADHQNDTLWQFETPVWHFPFILSNDGKTVAVVAWMHVKEEYLKAGDCVAFFTADGGRVGIPFSLVYPNPPKTQHVGIGPLGDFWRTWYNDVESHDDILIIHTTGGGSATFDLNQRALIGRSHIGLFKPTHLASALLAFMLVSSGFWFMRRRSKRRAKIESVGRRIEAYRRHYREGRVTGEEFAGAVMLAAIDAADDLEAGLPAFSKDELTEIVGLARKGTEDESVQRFSNAFIVDFNVEGAREEGAREVRPKFRRAVSFFESKLASEAGGGSGHS